MGCEQRRPALLSQGLPRLAGGTWSYLIQPTTFVSTSGWELQKGAVLYLLQHRFRPLEFLYSEGDFKNAEGEAGPTLQSHATITYKPLSSIKLEGPSNY